MKRDLYIVTLILGFIFFAVWLSELEDPGGSSSPAPVTPRPQDEQARLGLDSRHYAAWLDLSVTRTTFKTKNHSEALYAYKQLFKATMEACFKMWEGNDRSVWDCYLNVVQEWCENAFPGDGQNTVKCMEENFTVVESLILPEIFND